MLPQLLPEQSILLPLEAPNREAALAELIAALPCAKISARKKMSILDLILQREVLGTTAIGNSMALPHCFSDCVEEPLSVLGISRKGVFFPSLDGQLVHIVFLTVFPESWRGSLQKQNLLKDAEMVFRDRFLCERLKISESVEEAYEVFLREAGHLSGDFSKSA